MADKKTEVRVWRVVAAYLVLVVTIVVGFFRLDQIGDQREQDRAEAAVETRTAVACAFELVLAPFDAFAEELATVHDALASGGFPRVTVEQCITIIND